MGWKHSWHHGNVEVSDVNLCVSHDSIPILEDTILNSNDS